MDRRFESFRLRKFRFGIKEDCSGRSAADKDKFKSKRKFTFICTSFNLKGNRDQEKYLKKYLDMLESGGRLILTRYDDQKDQFVLLEEYLKQMGPKLDFLFAGSTEVHEITKVFWLEKMMDGKTFCLR